MLNRRTLRIKIMQALFAYEQCKEANYELGLDLIDERFSPDLNSMEVQDKPQLSKKRLEARSLYLKQKDSQVAQSQDSEINKAVSSAIKFYENQTRKDFTFFKKNLVMDVEKIHHWYIRVLGLILALEELSNTDKKSDYSNFRNNLFVVALKNDSTVQGLLLKHNLGWENERNLVMNWFRDIVKPNEVFQNYLKSQAPTIDDQKAIIKHLVRKLFLNDTAINDYFQEKNIHWAEDHDIVKSLVEKTIKSLDPESGKIQIQKLSMDWDDDLIFMNLLFEKTVQIEQANKELIASNTRNWEVDRLPLTDRVTLEMAITELINFPSIPVKVTINEYIELTKHYSTPKSAKFINGILDVIAKELVTTGKVKKSGKGLIDNK